MRVELRALVGGSSHSMAAPGRHALGGRRLECALRAAHVGGALHGRGGGVQDAFPERAAGPGRARLLLCAPPRAGTLPGVHRVRPPSPLPALYSAGSWLYARGQMRCAAKTLQ